MFSPNDEKYITDRGTTLGVVQQQIKFFEQGFPPLKLIKPALMGDGITPLNDVKRDRLLNDYQKSVAGYTIVKFVPASGAASRMFKELFSFMESYTGSDEDFQKMITNTGSQSPYTFFKNITKFAFYEDLKAVYLQGTGQSLENALDQRQYVRILEYFLTDRGLDYGNLPKGLLKFHGYADGSRRTPVEEHMVEGAHYAKDNDGIVRLHFTVSPEHKSKFAAHIEQIKSKYEKHFGVTYHITFSEQKKSTDTIAVDMNNAPFREPDGGLLFRPAGHGALIENLNDLDADFVFIKNIDNVVPDALRDTTYIYKKAMLGLLQEYQAKVFHYLEMLNAGVTEQIINEITAFVQKELCTDLGFSSGTPTADKVNLLRAKLHRPIRVCGMVRSEGDPGGGPFWALNPDGTVSLQVVETAQIDLNDPEQKSIFNAATHFNPVDLICGLKDAKGKNFDLTKHVDPMTGFITKKSKDGKDLKAQELPGLWNGAMSDWITVFVEVPVITFNPVKAVNDLLKPEHQ